MRIHETATWAEEEPAWLPPEFRWAYFRERCWAEGRSKAEVARHAGPAQALGSERSYVRPRTPSTWPAPFTPATPSD
jgi:hypothetical protein